MDDEVIEGEVIEPGVDPYLDEQIRDFEWRLDGLGRTYQQALWWASEQPFRAEVEDQNTERQSHTARRFVRACGAALVMVGEVLIERAGLEEIEPDEQTSENEPGFYAVPPLLFDFSNKE